MAGTKLTRTLRVCYCHDVLTPHLPNQSYRLFGAPASYWWWYVCAEGAVR